MTVLSLKQIIRLRCDEKFDEAIEAALNAYNATCDNCYLNQAYLCYMAQNKKREAAKILEKMTESEPLSVDLYKKLGFLYFSICDFENSIKYYKKALEIEPYSSGNNFNLGCAYHYKNDQKNAKLYYEQALRLDITNVSALNNLGLLYYENNNYKYALLFFENAIKNNPNHPEAYHHIGIINRNFLDDLRMSELYLKKAIRLDPNHAENYYELALTYKKANRLQEMIACAVKCLDLKPTHTKSRELINSYT